MPPLDRLRAIKLRSRKNVTKSVECLSEKKDEPPSDTHSMSVEELARQVEVLSARLNSVSSELTTANNNIATLHDEKLKLSEQLEASQEAKLPVDRSTIASKLDGSERQEMTQKLADLRHKLIAKVTLCVGDEQLSKIAGDSPCRRSSISYKLVHDANGEKRFERNKISSDEDASSSSGESERSFSEHFVSNSPIGIRRSSNTNYLSVPGDGSKGLCDLDEEITITTGSDNSLYLRSTLRSTFRGTMCSQVESSSRPEDMEGYVDVKFADQWVPVYSRRFMTIQGGLIRIFKSEEVMLKNENSCERVFGMTRVANVGLKNDFINLRTPGNLNNCSFRVTLDSPFTLKQLACIFTEHIKYSQG